MTSTNEGTQCVYSIVNRDVIDKAMPIGGNGEFQTDKRWVSAAKHLEMLDKGDVYPLLLSDAASAVGVSWISVIEHIEVLTSGTRIQFSSLMEVSPAIPFESILKLSDDQPLGRGDRGFYVPCLIQGGLEIDVLSALEDEREGISNPNLVEINSKTAADYYMALQALEDSMTEKQRAMLIGHAKAPGHVLSMRAIANIAGYAKFESANMQYGALGRKFANFFNVSGLPNQTHAMAWSDGAPDKSGHFTWTLRPELVDALCEIGWVSRSDAPDFELEVAAREVDADPNCTGVPATVRQALIEARVGQGAYRRRLLQLWDGKCALTGCDLKDVLIASHAKPWADSSNKERLDEYNGLLLAAHADKMFDSGLISFADDGALLVRADVRDEALATLGIRRTMSLNFVSKRHLPYLEAHRVKYGFAN